MTRKVGVGLLTAILFLSGCATMFSGKTQSVNFTSTPSGAKVFIDNQELVTPATATLSRKDRPRVTFQKEGYRDLVLDMGVQATDINNNTWWNVFNFGYGFIVDWVTGAIWQYHEQNHVVLEQK
jgi:hypothetical protein